MNNPFTNFNQRELEILELAILNLDKDQHFLPQHAERMDDTKWKLYKQIHEVSRAPSYSNDGSHFGEKWDGEK